MQQKTRRKAACCHDNQYKRFAGWERYLFDSWESAVVAQAFAEESHWMPKQFQQQQSGNLALATPARESVRGQSHNNAASKRGFLVWMNLNLLGENKKSLFYTSSRMGSCPANK
jgi:hypothetical protein